MQFGGQIAAFSGPWLIVPSSAVEAWSKSAPGVAKWTKLTVAKHITVGGLGGTIVGTPTHVADEFERWVDEADVDGFNIVRPKSRTVTFHS